MKSTELTLPGFTAEMSFYDTRTTFPLSRPQSTLSGVLIPAQHGTRCYRRCMLRAQDRCEDRCDSDGGGWGEIDVEPEL